MRRLMQTPDVYTDYFQSLLSTTVNITGDITPGYCLIDQPGLEQIGDILRRAGFKPRVIFLLRDPIDRIWSAARMIKREKISLG